MTLTTYTTTFSQQNGSTNELIDVIIQYGADFTGDGLNDIKITLALNPASNSGTEDIIGLAFDIQNNAVSDLKIVQLTTALTSGATSYLSPTTPLTGIAADDVGSGYLYDFNLSTNGGSALPPYDVGIKLNDQGLGDGQVQSTTFVLTSLSGMNSLNAEALLENTDWWIRLQSTNSETGSAKTGGHIGDLPTPGSFTPSLNVTKYVSVDGGQTWLDANSVTGPTLFAPTDGTNPQFKFVVQNTGNVALSNVSLTDNVYNLNLAPFNLTANDEQAGGTDEFTYIYTGATWAAGQHTDTATTSATYNGQTVSDTDPANYFGATPSIDIIKEVSIDGGANWFDANDPSGPVILAGQTVSFRVKVTNTSDGNLSMSGINVSDNTGLTFTGVVGTLAAGASDYSDVITTTAVAGQHTNTATATGTVTDGGGNSSTPSDNDNANYFGATPGIDIIKEVSIDGGMNWFDANDPSGPVILAGQTVSFRVKVTNTSDGNLSMSGINVSDNTGLTFTGVVGTLAAGASDYSDVITTTAVAGQHTNTATATGTVTDGGGHSSTPSDSDNANYFGATPSIDIIKEVSIDGGANWFDANDPSGPVILAGQTVSFRVKVTNTSDGNLSMSGINVSDNTGLTFTGVVGTLAAGASDYSDVITTTAVAGQHTNTATATGTVTDGGGHSSTPSDNDNANYFGATPGIDIIKEVSIDGGMNWFDANDPSGPVILAGQTVSFRVKVTNTSDGNLSMSGINVSDNTGLTFTGVVGTLAAGASDYSDVITTTAVAGQHTNTATATGTVTDGGGNSSTPSDSDKANYFGAAPSIDVEKYVSVDGGKTWLDADTATGPLAADPQYGGTNPQFKFVVQNTGNVALSNITLSDNKFDLNGAAAGTSITINSLAANDGAVGGADEYSFTFTGAAWQAGQHTDIATVSATYTDQANHTANLTDSDAANYYGVSGPGTGTPGFWKQWTAVWDGNTSNDNTFNTKANFAKADILYKVIDPVTGTNTQTGILVGDFNKNGITDGSEKTIFYTVAEAQAILNSSTATDNQDARYILDKQLISSWLNVLAGNEYTQIQTDITNGVQWLQNRTPNEGGTAAGDGSLTVSASTWRVASSSEAWNGILSNTAPLYQKGSGYGVQIKNVLDYYNNTGAGFAIDRDTGLVGGDLTTLNTLQAYQPFF